MKEKLARTENRHRLLVEKEMGAVVSIESELLRAARRFFEHNDYTEVVTPHVTRITGSCENIDTLFGLDYFGDEAYLVQTGQLYLEALIPSMGNVFCVGPSFRAESSVDGRHLTEFTLMELEFPGDFDDLLETIERLVCSMVQSVVQRKRKELGMLGVDAERLRKVRTPFRRISYTEAIDTLKKEGVRIEWGEDLSSRYEKILVKDGIPTFITHFPEAIKFFNMRRNPLNPRVVNSADLILPFSGEAVGAAEREFDHRLLRKKLLNSEMFRMLKKRGKTAEDFGWYMDIVRNHGIQHSGCGIGLNRVTQFILGSEDIRMSTAYPMNRVSLM